MGSQAPDLVVSTVGGSRRVSAGGSIVVGRSHNCEIVIDDARVSRRHARIAVENGQWVFRDLGSMNGTFLDGSQREATAVTRTSVFRLGAADGPELTLVPQLRPVLVRSVDPVAPATIDRSFAAAGRVARSPEVGADSRRLTIGRSQDNTVVLTDLLVSRRHAVVVVEAGAATIRDLGSANGTFVNGRRVTSQALVPGDRIGLGNGSFLFDGSGIRPIVEGSEPSLSAHGLTVSIAGRRLLSDVSFKLAPRSLMAVVGPSGAGKSTLLGALTGQRPATMGTVVFADRDLYAEYDELRSRIGLVPQSDLLHATLTTRRALEYGAELRFPADTTALERRRRVQEVMDELGLSERAELRIDKLSGGQRKRTSVAIELLTKPALLFLDEPTSGLDPGLDQQVMSLLRKLADDGRTVVVVTHSVANLGMCDAVMVLAEGGLVAYLGPPSGVLEYFGARDWADVFVRLDGTPGEVWHQRFVSSPSGERAGATVDSPPALARVPVQLAPIVKQTRLAQTRTLARRGAAVLASDRGFVRLMVLMPLTLAGLGYAVTDATGLGSTIGPTGAPLNTHARSLLMVFLLGAVFIGTAASIQEIAKERTIYMRERAIGLSLSAYLGSKVLVLGLITAVQGAVFCLLALAGRPGPPDPILLGMGKLEIVLLVVGLTVVSMCVGLAVSSFVKSVEMAMPALVVITMTQVILSGAVPVGVELLLNVLGWIAPAYWAMGAMAGTTNLSELAAIPIDDQRWNWAPQLDVWLWNVWVLGVCGAVALAIAVAGLRRLDPVRR